MTPDRTPSGGEPPRPVNGFLVALGVVAGVLLSWMLTFTLLNSSAMAEGPALTMSLGVPALLAVIGLLVPAVRQFSAGLLLGVCIGAIVGAGVCGLLFLQLMRM
ncbi:hypothetical protein [Ornithinicoccus hortensis]|uniref:Uncharacterized protein n=1 Tax=Ornithinicoccus hortensis TaxID=82346 RepID=A0A542YTB8_9MICO|nr:hypothetical protein [Ornithinicoccus hortensis]TQL51328.1 hypothetical protein FB467_2470 [Ornithinicoccus hortensis]